MGNKPQDYKKREVKLLLRMDESEGEALDELCEEGESRQDVLRRLIAEAIEKPDRVVGRMKMIVRHFADGVPHSKSMRKHLCRGQSRQDVIDRTRAYFDLYRAHEAGDERAFDAWLARLSE